MTRHNLQPLQAHLEELSLRCFGTRWYNGMTWWGYRFLETGPQHAGRGQVTMQDIRDLDTAKSDLGGGWMLYPLGYAAYIDHHRWMMAYGGGPDRVIQETRRLETKLQRALDQEDHLRVDQLLQGKARWY